MSEGGPHYRLRETELTWRVTSDATVVLDQRKWVYLSLNGSGAVLWAAISTGASAAELARLLEERYGLDAERAGRDVEAFVAVLGERELLAAPG